MESLNAECLVNILEYFDLKERLTLSKVSSKWNKFVDELCFSEITSFQNVNSIFQQYEPEFYPQLPLLGYREGLDLISRVAPHLKILIIRPHFSGESAYLQFGPHLLKMNNFDLSNLFEIIYEKCVNLEEVSIDTHKLSSKLMAKIVENNPKLRVLSLPQSAIRDIFPNRTTIPSLQGIYLHGSYEDIEGFSSLSEHFTAIDMSCCCITPESLPKLLQEIVKHKEYLQCLRIKLTTRRSKDPDCSVLAVLGLCSALTELRIDVEEGDQILGDFFIDIVKGCTNLEFVDLNNMEIDDETYNQLIALPNLEEANINIDSV